LTRIPRREVDRLVLRQLQDRSLRRRIDRAPRGPELPTDAADVDDRTPRRHVRRDLANEDGASDEVDVQAGEPFLARRVDTMVGVDDGVVDEEVDPLKPLERGRHAAGDRRVLGQVGADEERPLPELGCDGGPALLVTRRDDDRRARGDERRRDRRAEVRVASRDDRDASSQLRHLHHRAA
jgi:hypothetical protein